MTETKKKGLKMKKVNKGKIFIPISYSQWSETRRKSRIWSGIHHQEKGSKIPKRVALYYRENPKSGV